MIALYSDAELRLPADTAEVGEDGRQAPQRRVEELAELVVLGVLVGFNELGGVVGVGSAMGAGVKKQTRGRHEK